MNTALTLYTSACTALTEARTLLDAKDVADKAMALKEYGRLANDRSLEIEAAELRIRAERRLGQMLAATERNPGAAQRGSEKEQRPKLEEIGVDRKLSSRAQQLAAISEPAIEARIARWRTKAEHGAGRITVNLLRDEAEKTPKAPVSPLKASAWQKATDEQCLDFLEAVNVAEIVDVFGAAEFYRSIRSDQRQAFLAAERADREARRDQLNGQYAHS